MISKWLDPYDTWESDIYSVAAILNHNSSDFDPVRHISITPIHSLWNYRVIIIQVAAGRNSRPPPNYRVA